ncbi:MAG: potassium transporter TrkG [Planctomycetota bacterium]
MLNSSVRRPEPLLAATFAILIAVGTGLLCLPAAQAEDRVGVLDALFTATSAVCVTGLITVDTATAWSRFGQTVILVLIQLGGLGIMTFGVIAAEVLRLRVSFAALAASRGALFEHQLRGDLRSRLHRLLLLVLLVELFGFGLIHRGLESGAAPHGGRFEAAFLTVSAFCNAGFSIYSDNVAGLSSSPLIMGTLMALVIVGGLGYAVLLEVAGRAWNRLRGRGAGPVRWSLQTRVVLTGSALLIVAGAVTLFVFGIDEARGSPAARLGHAVFQSVSARTAGFNTVRIEALPVPSLLILIALMFVGGSPGSCAGGVKITTAAVWLARIGTRLTNREAVNIGGRQLPQDLVRRATLLLALAAVWNLVGIMVLSLSEEAGTRVRFEHVMFEQVSAFGTVGLSAGLTPLLSPVGKIWIMASMFVGRLGPLTVALAMLKPARERFAYPPERIMIG